MSVWKYSENFPIFSLSVIFFLFSFLEVSRVEQLFKCWFKSCSCLFIPVDLMNASCSCPPSLRLSLIWVADIALSGVSQFIWLTFSLNIELRFGWDRKLLYKVSYPRAVVGVYWSASSSSTPAIRFQILLANNLLLSVLRVERGKLIKKWQGLTTLWEHRSSFWVFCQHYKNTKSKIQVQLVCKIWTYNQVQDSC